ncbi:hypothetical protein HIM_00261 [Hirsutella minnesotensis 3608]|nr:hypothetical protein HIM_00261 [Hirsutella minnesotensis 3608]
MPSTERSPLLPREVEDEQPQESTRLLSEWQHHDNDTEEHDDPTPAVNKKLAKVKSRWRWPSIIAILVLAALVVVIIVLGFLTPPAVKQYVENAAVLEPTSLFLESLTADGVRARIQANVRLDASRVSDDNARRIGRFVTGIMRKLEAESTKVDVRLPHYQNALFGTAVVPPLILDLVDGHNNELDFVADIVPGDAEILRKMVNEWLDGKLETVKLTGAAALRLKSGIFPLGSHNMVESMVFEAKQIPSIPEYKIQNLTFFDAPIGHKGQKGVGANVSMILHNDYPLGLDIPSLGLQVLVPNCDASEANVEVATAVTDVIHVRPEADILARASGVVRQIPDSLIRPCPKTKLSPLDNFVNHYLRGESAKVLVRGKIPAESNLPGWFGSLLESIVVPIEFSGQNFDSLIRNFSLTDVNFKLPSPFADPNDPSGKPQVSGTVRVVAALPAEVKVDLNVDGLKADGDLIFHGRKFGELHLAHWQEAKSSIRSDPEDEDIITITSRVVNAPIDIVDSDVFGDIMQKLLFGDDDITLDVQSLVDVRVSTVLGKLVLRGIPAKGKIPVKHIPGDNLHALDPQVGDLRVVNTSKTGITLEAKVNLTNVTPYTARVPFISVHVVKDGFIMGEAVVKDVDLRQGNNTGITVTATWDPTTFGRAGGQEVGRKLLSDYISGKNTSIDIKTHRRSVPTVPLLGQALSNISVTFDAPRLKLPDDGSGEDVGHGFIREASFHILSSTAAFTLASPLRHNTVHILHINATAFYNHTEPVGQIVDGVPFDAKPGLSRTPRLPVQWSAGHVGLDKLRQALGGTLKLDAVANVTVRLGNWMQQVEYHGRGIGARVHLL